MLLGEFVHYGGLVGLCLMLYMKFMDNAHCQVPVKKLYDFWYYY